MDYEEMMLQISDVMRKANRVRPIISHEEAVKAIRNIVTPKGRWIIDSIIGYTNAGGSAKDYKPDTCYCSNCLYGFDVFDNRTELFDLCPNCGARMER